MSYDITRRRRAECGGGGMTGAKHTPGPWVFGNRHTNNGVFTAKGDLIANTHSSQLNFDRDEQIAEQDANAHLIAAAPDFADNAPRAIEMLRVAAAFIREHDPDGTYHYDEADCDGYCIADDCESAAETLQDAIAKAKGGDA